MSDVDSQIDELNTTTATLLANRRERRLFKAVVVGVVWSLLYTGLSLGLLYDLSRDNISCSQFAASREDIRAVILSSPQFQGEITEERLAEILPPVQCD